MSCLLDISINAPFQERTEFSEKFYPRSFIEGPVAESSIFLIRRQRNFTLDELNPLLLHHSIHG
ncbi:hypothetical protein ASE03_31010 [Kitasatospora sp. Root187]|nr:hypothetical protein ASC99_31795 [Kitasatospora sp. Root107]KRB66250.1 hypothetical protein ASE03_31010 [Kitasatospora sp. Root187]